jgi:hypothetical protein
MSQSALDRKRGTMLGLACQSLWEGGGRRESPEIRARRRKRAESIFAHSANISAGTGNRMQYLCLLPNWRPGIHTRNLFAVHASGRSALHLSLSLSLGRTDRSAASVKFAPFPSFRLTSTLIPSHPTTHSFRIYTCWLPFVISSDVSLALACKFINALLLLLRIMPGGEKWDVSFV